MSTATAHPDRGPAEAPSAGESVPAPAVLPELLAPAGDWDCARAAVENGADAIYFGLDRFNARIRAHNFTEPDLPRLMEFLHRRGVKGYVTFNTLVFADEMAQAEATLRVIIAAGVDAVLVQDAGICRLIRRLSPDFPIHASTQMTVTSAAGIAFARELGCSRVVLARECSLKEIERIRAAASEESSTGREVCLHAPDSPETAGIGRGMGGRPSMPLEVFVHGALCVAYSGQCLTSEALGGRSANRGECAQACRMPYELISDGRPVPLGDRRYLLSPQDLAGLDVLPDLVRAGVASLKIEGRLKSPEYVANITRVYRKAIDETGRPAGQARPAGDAGGGMELEPDPRRYDLEMAFSRGLSTGWLRGIDNQKLVHARFGKKRGVYLGEVTEVRGDAVRLQLRGPLKPGDGVVFDAGRPEEREEGGRVYQMSNVECRMSNDGFRISNGESRMTNAGRSPAKGPARQPEGTADDGGGRVVELRFGRGDIDFARVHAGDRVWKTSDPELDRRLRATFDGDQPRFQRPLNMEAHGGAGRPLTVLARDGAGHVATADSAMALTRAETQPLTAARLREQLGRLGGTGFRLDGLINRLEGDVMLPVKELNRMRRAVVAELDRLRAAPRRWMIRPEVGAAPEAPSDRTASPLAAEAPTIAPELIVLVRSLPQIQAAIRCHVRTLYCELEDPKKYREAVAMVRQGAPGYPGPAGGPAAPCGAQIFVAPPRIFKPGEEWILRQVRSCEADGYLVRNYDHLEFFRDCRRVGDFSFNVANALSAEHFIERHGLERVTASYDLNLAQLEALLRSAPPAWFEITVHQHMPMFHMEHCVFCAFLSTGTDFTNCGRPCDRHDVRLRDRVGAQHPLRADAGCRNTVFNALAQSGAEGVARLLALGARRFRIEFLDESEEQVARTIESYRQLMRGEMTGTRLWRELKLLNQLGVTRGQLLR